LGNYLNMDDTLTGILRDVCMVLDVDVSDVMGKTRTRDLVEARVIYANIARMYTYHTLTDIGNTIGKDHSSIVHYEKTHNDLSKYDKEYQQKIRDCKAVVVPRKKIQESKLRCLIDRVYYRNQFLQNRLVDALQENEKLKSLIKEKSNALNVLQESFTQSL
tara:strand:- start:7974 stop:8456 length:483 start_codon:yes stop_codon:yes gene_type:complete